MGDRPTIELVDALQTLYHTREYADLLLICSDGSRRPVHKAILCPRSRFFASTVKENRWKVRSTVIDGRRHATGH